MLSQPQPSLPLVIKGACLHHCNCILNQITSDDCHHPNITSRQRAPWYKLTTVPFIWAVTAVCLPITPELTWHTFMVGTFKFTLFTKCCKDKTMFHWEKEMINVKFTLKLKKKNEKEGEGRHRADLWSEQEIQDGRHSGRRWLLPGSGRGHHNSEGRKGVWKWQGLWWLSIISSLVIGNLSKSLRSFKWKYCVPCFLGDWSKSVYFFMFEKNYFTVMHM